jgi:type IV secretion system protein VirB10
MNKLWIALAATAFALGQQNKPANRIAPDGTAILAAGTRIPLTLMSTVSSKSAVPGDQVYLRTMVPVAVEGKVVIPPGAYVQATVTESKRPGKVKGRGELSIQFDSLMFNDGHSVDLTGRLGAMDGDNPGTVDRAEGKVSSDGSAGRDTMVVGGSAIGGAAMGNWIGGQGKEAGIGAGAGAAAGAAAVLLTRGPEAVLKKGSTLEMVLSRDVTLKPGRGR